jgi:hypothetical protein
MVMFFSLFKLHFRILADAKISVCIADTTFSTPHTHMRRQRHGKR